MPLAFTLILLFLAALVASWYLVPTLWARLLLRLWRRQAGLTSYSITVDGIRWHYLKGGEGPALLLLHGFGADTSCWLPLATILRQRFSLLIPDLPGFGESEPPDNLRFDIKTQADRLVGFLDALEIKQCLVAGNSMGGYLATAFAALEPARVRALWLLAPLGVQAVSPGYALEAIDSGQVVAGQVGSVREYKDVFLPGMFFRQPWIPYPLLKAQADLAISRQEMVPWMLAQARFESEPLENIAKKVQQATLIQWGRDDQILNPDGLPVLEKVFRHVTVAYTPECGHLPMFEKPAESSDLFLKFLTENPSLRSG